MTPTRFNRFLPAAAVATGILVAEAYLGSEFWLGVSAFSPCIPQSFHHDVASSVFTAQAERRVSTFRLQATSSSDLKKKGSVDGSLRDKPRKSASSSNRNDINATLAAVTVKTFPKDSVVSRLKQAATRAAAKARLEEEEAAKKEQENLLSVDPRFSTRIRNLAQQGSGSSSDASGTTSAKTRKLGTVTELSAMIDAQLSRARQGLTMNTNVQHQQSQPPRDSMTAVMTHNGKTARKESSVDPIAGSCSSRQRNVAVILSKPLVDDQITLEFAARIQRLVRAMQYEDYRPDVICFVEGYGKSSSSSNSHNRNATTLRVGGVAADCDMGYSYLRHLATALDLNVSGIIFHLERTSIQNGALGTIADLIQRDCVPVWIKGLMDTTAAVTFEPSRKLVRKLYVQFWLVSSEYHLCILNDIHVRSPGQSPLRSLERWPSVSISAAVPMSHTTVQLETTWTYLYATTANMRLTTSLPDESDRLVATFVAACYKRSQDLIPVLQNLRGVVADKEFFQRDNYRVLVQARRALVSDMELLYQQQPSLAAVHRILSPPMGVENTKVPLDVVLEGALLSLGRCLDLVRPAGLLTGTVPPQDFRLAVNVLEQAVSQISVACDPDQILPPSDWGTLFLGDNSLLSTADSTYQSERTHS
jgi:hypothetical protein